MARCVYTVSMQEWLVTYVVSMQEWLVAYYTVSMQEWLVTHRYSVQHASMLRARGCGSARLTACRSGSLRIRRQEWLVTYIQLACRSGSLRIIILLAFRSGSLRIYC